MNTIRHPGGQYGAHQGTAGIDIPTDISSVCELMDPAVTHTSVQALEHAFAAKARIEQAAGDRQRVGVFGGDFPVLLAAASGFDAIDVEMEPDADRALHYPGIEGYIEPFVDWSTRRFLHRLALGAFDAFSAIIFTRASPSAYLAYLYATEFRRQGLIREGPVFHLWNFQLTGSQAAAAFNLAEARRLESALKAAGGRAWSQSALRTSTGAEIQRGNALKKLARLREAGRISGTSAMRWRNAGRYLPAPCHARLLEAALEHAAGNVPRRGPRIGLIGSPIALPALYELLEEAGLVVADPHPHGDAWPPPCPADADADLEAVLAAVAASLLDPRVLPVPSYRNAVADACVGAKCDLVVIQVHEHDDCFGWDLPSIRAALASAGIAEADLGFRPAEPGEDWIEWARSRLADAVLRLQAEGSE
jgi:hypothetical protein